MPTVETIVWCSVCSVFVFFVAGFYYFVIGVNVGACRQACQGSITFAGDDHCLCADGTSQPRLDSKPHSRNSR